MRLLDVLRHEADLRARVALVVEAVNGLAIVGLADLLDVFLEALVREEPAAARRGGGGSIARQRPGALGDVRKELGHLEGVRLTLLKLIVEGLLACLLGLLLGLTSGHLSLRTGEASLLRIGAEAGEVLGRIGAHVVALLAKGGELLPHLLGSQTVGLRSPQPDTLLLLGGCEGLIVVLLVEGRDSLRLSEALLALQCGALQARAFPTKGTRADGVALLLR